MKDNFKSQPFFALEGPAFAGKTTIINYLRDNFNDQVIVIPEASEYVGGDKYFPSVPFETFDDARASTQFFIELEKHRCQKAVELQHEHNLPVILDRSTPLSTVLFYSLLEEKFPQLHEAKFKDSFKQHSIEIFRQEIEKGTFFIPENFILLKPKNKEVFEKRLSRGAKNSMFSHWSSVEFLLSEYQKVLRASYLGHVIELETENTSKNLEKCAKKIIEFVKKPIQNNQINNFFGNFQGVLQKKSFNTDSIEEENEYHQIRKHVQSLIERAQCQQM